MAELVLNKFRIELIEKQIANTFIFLTIQALAITNIM